jgi:O-antigen ligase
MREWILQRFQVYGRVMLMAGVFLAPVIFDRGTADIFNLVKFTTLWVTGMAALVLFLAWSAERRVWPPRFKLLNAAAVFLAVCALATIFSQNRLLSLIGLYHRYGGLVSFVLYAVIMVVIAGLYWERPEDLKEVARASAAGSLVMSAYILIQAANLDWIHWSTANGGRPPFPVGTMGNSNFAGDYLGIAVPFLFYVAMAARRPIWKTFWSALVGLDLLALWYTQTRGGMIAAFAGLVTFALMNRKRIPRWANVALAFGLALSAVTALLVLWHPGSSRPPGPLARFETLRTSTFTIRLYYWDAARRIFLDHPILGTGLQSYAGNYPSYRLPQDGALLGLGITDDPHSIFFNYAATTGILGLGAYLALIGLALWYGFRQAGRLDGPRRLLLVAFVSALVGYLAEGAVSIDIPPLAVMGWVALGGIAALADPKLEAAREKAEAELPKGRPGLQKKPKSRNGGGRAGSGRPLAETNPRPALWPVHVALALTGAFIIGEGTRPFLADVKAKDTLLRQTNRTTIAQALQKVQQAIRYFPLEPAYRTLAAGVYENLSRVEPDLKMKRRWIALAADRRLDVYRRQPKSVSNMEGVATTYQRWGSTLDPAKYYEADRWFTRAVAFDPTDWQLHANYGEFLANWARIAGDQAIRLRAEKQMTTAVRMHPDDAPTWVKLGKLYQALGEPSKAKAAFERASRIDSSNQEAKNLLDSI